MITLPFSPKVESSVPGCAEEIEVCKIVKAIKIEVKIFMCLFAANKN